MTAAAAPQPAAPGAEEFFASRHLVMYSDLNAHGLLFGGTLMGWLDASLAQVAMRLMGTSRIVTKKFGEIVFENPGRLGDSVEIWCRVEREGRTSLTLAARVLVRRFGASSTAQPAPEPRQICHCDVVYVALDSSGRPAPWRAQVGGT